MNLKILHILFLLAEMRALDILWSSFYYILLLLSHYISYNDGEEILAILKKNPFLDYIFLLNLTFS